MESISLNSATKTAPAPTVEREQQTEQRKRKCDETWVCPASAKSIRTVNPVRDAIDPIAKGVKRGFQRADRKEPISLAHGDATVSGNLHPCKNALDAVIKAALYNRQSISYANACGTHAARVAIARHHSYPEHRISADNVVVANGCSGALELAITALLDPGTSILVPEPGFPLYQTIAESHGASVVHYRLDPENQWQCDMDHLRELMESHSNVRAMIVNNPSSPTGAVFSAGHLKQIIEFARDHRLPIVADEVYGDLTFGENKFHPVAQIAAQLGRQVPVITASGISKQYLLPGWRVGWLTFHDNLHSSLKEVEKGVDRLAQVTHGASHLIQSVIPPLLSPTTSGVSEWKESFRLTLQRQSNVLCSKLEDCIGLDVIRPQGAMYAMVRIDTDILDVTDDMGFASMLLEEENVFILPGKACGAPNYFRVVYCSSEPVLEAAARRISSFCRRHVKV